MASPLSATSSGLTVSTTAPSFIEAPRTSALESARTSTCGPSSVIGVALRISALKPMVWALAMLLAMTRSRVIELAMPDRAV